MCPPFCKRTLYYRPSKQSALFVCLISMAKPNLLLSSFRVCVTLTSLQPLMLRFNIFISCEISCDSISSLSVIFPSGALLFPNEACLGLRSVISKKVNSNVSILHACNLGFHVTLVVIFRILHNGSGIIIMFMVVPIDRLSINEYCSRPFLNFFKDVNLKF